MLRELNQLQIRVDHCHGSSEGQDLWRKLADHQRIAEASDDLSITADTECSQKKRDCSENVQEWASKRPRDQKEDSYSVDDSFSEAEDEEGWVSEDQEQEDFEDELEPEQAGSLFDKIEMWSDFIGTEQPDDSTRERMSLLSLAPGKVWTHEDLKTQEGLELGLLLLYNLSRGTTTFHLTRSIHIEYKSLPKKVVEAAMKR